MYNSNITRVDACNLNEAMYLQRVMALELILGIELKPALKSQLKGSLERDKFGSILQSISDCAGLHSESFGVKGERVRLTHQRDDEDESKYILTFTHYGEIQKESIRSIAQKVLDGRPDLRRYFISHPLEDLISRYLQFTDDNWSGKGIRDNGLTVKCSGFSEYDLDKRKLQLRAIVMAGAYLNASFMGEDINKIVGDSNIDEAVGVLMTPSPRFPLVDIYTESGELKTIRCHDYQDFVNRGQLGAHYTASISGRSLSLDISVPSFEQRTMAENTLRVFNDLFSKPTSKSMWDHMERLKETESAKATITPRGDSKNQCKIVDESDLQGTPKF